MTLGESTTIVERMNGTFVFYAGYHKGIIDLRSSDLFDAAISLKKITGLFATHWIPKYGKKQLIPGVIMGFVGVNQA